MNKKYFGITSIIVVLLLLIACMNIKPKSADLNENKLSNDMSVILTNANNQSKEYKESDEQGDFVEIDVNKYLEYYSGTEDKIIFIARPTCQYCQIAAPIVSKLIYKYKLEINYLNTDNFTEEDKINFSNSNEKFSQGASTPKLIIISNNEIKDEVDGLTDYAHYNKFLKDNKFIK